MLIEQTHDNSLITVSDKDVFLLAEGRLQLDCSMLEEPCKVTVGVFMLVKFIELLGTHFQFRWEGASSCLLFWPVSIS